MGLPTVARPEFWRAKGWQAFAGGEVTFAGAPQFAFSADLGYRRLNAPVEGFDLGGLGLSLSAHWYVK